jgi:hypothetical protein
MATLKYLTAFVVLFTGVLCLFAQNGQHDFTPTLGQSGFELNITGGVVNINNAPSTIFGTTLLATANATNYVYVDLVAGVIGVNTSGFTVTQYPVAEVVTNKSSVVSLTDVRPGAFPTVVGGVGGGTVVSVATGTGLSGGPISISGTISLSTPVTAANGGTGEAGTLTGILYGNGASAHTVATPAQAATLLQSLTGCNTVGNVLTPQGSDCVAQTGGGGLSGMTAGQLALAASASTVTSSIATTNTTYFPFQSLTTNGTSGAATLNAGTGVLNIPNYVNSGTTTSALTLSNSGSGASSGATFNGSVPVTISYNSIGAAPLTVTTLSSLTTAAGGAFGTCAYLNTCGGSSGSPGGSNGQFQYNNSGSFAGATGITEVSGAVTSLAPTVSITNGTTIIDNITGDAGAAINTAFSTYSVVEVTAATATATTLITIPKGGTLRIRGRGPFTNVGIRFTDSTSDFTGTGALDCPEKATVILSNSVNVALLSQVNFSSLTGTTSTYGLDNVKITGCTFDGNSTHNTSGWGIQVFGRGFQIENVIVQNVAGGCYWFENGGGSVFEVPGDDPTSTVAHFKGINCGSHGVYVPAGQGWILTDGTTWDTGGWGLYVLAAVGVNYFNTYLNATGGCYAGTSAGIQGSGIICTNAAGWGLLVDSGSGANQMAAGTYACNGCIGMELRAPHQLISGQVDNSSIGTKFNGGGGVLSLNGFGNTTDFNCTSMDGNSIIDWYSLASDTFFDATTCGSATSPVSAPGLWRWGGTHNGNQLWQTFNANGWTLNFPNGPAGGTLIAAGSDGGLAFPSTVTGGDKGAGTINASGLYVNGVAVGTGGGSGTVNTAPQYDVTYYTSSGSNNVVGGAAISGFQYDSTSGAPAAATAAQAATLIQGLTGCNTSGFVFTPQTSNCVAQTGGGGITGLTAGVIPQAGSATTIANSSPQLDNGLTNVNTLTYAGTAGITASAGPLTSGNPSGGVGSSMFLTQEGTAPTGISTSGQDNCYASSTQHGVLCNFNAGSTLPLVEGATTVVSGHLAVWSGTNGGQLADGGAPPAGSGPSNITITVGATAVPANSCLPTNTTFNTATMTSLATTMTLSFTPNASIASATGWEPSGPTLYFNAYPTANTLNWQVCNNSAASITPTSTTWNVSAH